MQKSFIVFLAVVLLGIIGATFVYRYYQTDPEQARVLENRSSIELTDADKTLIDVRDSTSKWLLGLAMSLLPGLVLTKSEKRESVLQDKHLPLLAGALLLVSLYGFFLGQNAVAFVMSQGPQYHLYGWVSNFPLLLQFWSLLLALVLLMVHWLKPSGKVGSATLFLLLGFLAPPEFAKAAVVTREATKPCVDAWAKGRDVTFTSEDTELAAKVVVSVARRAAISPGSICEFVSTQMDYIRFLAREASGPGGPFSVQDVLRETSKDLSSTGISPGALLEKILSSSALWNKPSGLLRLEGQPNGSTVLINLRPVGLTNLDLRLAPGRYVVEVLSAGEVVFRKDDVVVEDGKLWKATFGN